MEDNELDEFFYITCIPLKWCKQPPMGVEDSFIDKCKVCRRKMWNSKKKKEIHEMNKHKSSLLCIPCSLEDMSKKGIDISEMHVIDLHRVQH